MNRCGIVDIGSNTIRLSVYGYGEGKTRRLLDKKETAGLARFIENGILSQEGIKTACRVLNSGQRLMDNLEIGELYAFATAPLRNISNTAQALEEIEDATGLSIDVLSGDEEARLSFQGAIQGMSLKDGLLVDLGGGSTELVRFRDGAYQFSFSVPTGSLALFSRHVSGLFPSKAERRAIRDEITARLKTQDTSPAPAADMCGVGGTIRAACKIANRYYDRPDSCHSLTAQELEEIYDELKKPGQSSLQLMLSAAPDRLHTILPGLIVLRTVVRRYNCQRIQVSRCGVREGYLMEKVLHREEKQ